MWNGIGVEGGNRKLEAEQKSLSLYVQGNKRVVIGSSKTKCTSPMFSKPLISRTLSMFTFRQAHREAHWASLVRALPMQAERQPAVEQEYQ